MRFGIAARILQVCFCHWNGNVLMTSQEVVDDRGKNSFCHVLTRKGYQSITMLDVFTRLTSVFAASSRERTYYANACRIFLAQSQPPGLHAWQAVPPKLMEVTGDVCNVTWMLADSWEVLTAEKIGSQLGSRFPREVDFRGLPNGCRGEKKPKITQDRFIECVCESQG